MPSLVAPKAMLSTVVVLGLLSWTAIASADDAFFRVPLSQLKIRSGEPPKDFLRNSIPLRTFGWNSAAVSPRAVLDGDGEIYPAGSDELGNRFDVSVEALCIRVPATREVTGALFVPKNSGPGMEKLQFTVPAAAADAKHRTSFYRAKAAHYRWLTDLQIPGGSWFRYQERLARAAMDEKTPAEFEAADRRGRNEFQPETPLEETFDVFSGGRAISENLQLDRLLPPTAPEEPTVDVAKLPGITVAEMDWRPLVKDLNPETDPLAAMIPSDQHVLLFPTFGELLQLMDAADWNLTPALRAVTSRSDDAQTLKRYKRQLCLSVDGLSRLLGDRVVSSVALTGSDPYLLTGTDVAILFEARNAPLLTSHFGMRHTAALKDDRRCKSASGVIRGVKYTGVVAPDQSVCSYMAQIGDAVVVTNSLVQLKRIVETSARKSESLAALPEYRFFRDRYRRGKDETGLLIVTDKALRRWCSAKWRIASSRRTRAAAILGHYQAQFTKELVNHAVEPHEISTILRVPDLGTLRLTDTGVASSTYGTMEFQTPIAELDFAKVTKTESELYERWRQGYQRNWSQFFDPIAVKFSVRDERLFTDATVMPLIELTEYREFIKIASGAVLKQAAGDRHAGSLVHLAVAVNPKSERLKWANSIVEGPVKVSILGWLGDSVSVFVDADPFWDDLAAAMKTRPPEMSADGAARTFLEANIHRLPVAITAEVKDSLKLALFLSGVRAFIEQSSPGLLNWTTQEYHGQPYVKIAAAENSRDAIPVFGRCSVYYAPTPQRLIVTLNEDLLKRSIDRQIAAKKPGANDGSAKSPSKSEGNTPRPWLGESLALQLDGKATEMLQETFGRRDYRVIMQAQAWANLPILNEWKRLFPERDPVAVHQQVWQTALVCPGEGKYVWNEEFRTMESTVYGHPAAPKAGLVRLRPLERARWIDCGVTFENRGLRAKLELRRTGERAR